ncbi:MAG: hypothetical protein K2O42_10135, partial [Oscillospiraceae bacterium]|nr:hypothetical protein [Oscillospiraceae bacterium]
AEEMPEETPEETPDKTPDKVPQNTQTEFIYENRRFFCATILNAFLLCCHDPNLKQHAQINLNQNPKNKEIEILITIAAEKQNSNSIFADILLESPNKTNEFIMEKNFLEVFCSLHEGTWELLHNKNEKVSQNICKIVIKTAESVFLEFHRSRKGNHEREFYNICEMIFAEFRSSKIII